MKLLVVEDNETNISSLDDELKKIPSLVFSIVRSKESALEALKDPCFDLVLLDLKIPSRDFEMDADESHGLAVHASIVAESSGTPVLFFSGFGTMKFLTDLLSKSHQEDLWGSGTKIPLTNFRRKEELDDCIAIVVEYATLYAEVSRVEISSGGKDLKLEPNHKKALKIFSRIYNGSNVRASALGGGLSSARTLRLEVTDANDGLRCLAFCKLDSIDKVQDEFRRYKEHIAPILASGFTSEIRFISHGCGPIGGVFYQFAEGYDRSLLDVLSQDPAQSPQVIKNLWALEERWYKGSQITSISMADLRRALVSDDIIEKFADELHPRLKELESKFLNIRMCAQHRDLHPLNLLVNVSDQPLMIDYGDVKIAPACMDPVTLEFSLFFHPGCVGLLEDWPSVEEASTWPHLENYLDSCPLASHFKACREWAFKVQGSDQAVYATVYTYCVRQLKYPQTDHKLAIAFANAALGRLAAGFS